MSMPDITPSTENGNLSISRAAFVHEAELKQEVQMILIFLRHKLIWISV